MSLITVLMILGAVAAFAYGVWAGLGRWDQSPEEIERALEEDRARRKATRHFTPLDLMSRLTGVRVHRDRKQPFRFREDETEKERHREVGRVGRTGPGEEPRGNPDTDRTGPDGEAVG